MAKKKQNTEERRLKDATGFEWLSMTFAGDQPTKGYRFHADGNGELDFTTGRGTFVRYRGRTVRSFGDGIPDFPPGDVVFSASFEVELLDPGEMKYAAKHPRFFDEHGAEVGADGERATPTPSAVLVEADGHRFWRDGDVYSQMNGTTAFVVTALATGDAPARVDVFDEAGKKLVFPSPAPETFANAEAFVARFEAVFGEAVKTRGVKVLTHAHSLAVSHFEHTKYDYGLACTVILSNGGGDEVFVIDEPGKYQGHVFWNLHDEGLSTLDSVDELIEEESIEAETKDDLIEALPFFENLVAKSLDELWLGLTVVPAVDYASLVAKLKPV